MIDGIITIVIWIVVIALCGALALLLYTIASMAINRYYRRKRQMDKLQAENAFLRRTLESERAVNRKIREDYYASEK